MAVWLQDALLLGAGVVEPRDHQHQRRVRERFKKYPIRLIFRAYLIDFVDRKADILEAPDGSRTSMTNILNRLNEEQLVVLMTRARLEVR